MTVTPTKLRENLFSLLDEAIETGKVLDVKRKGHILHIVPEKKLSKLDNIVPKKITNASDEEIIDANWEKEWKPFI